MDFVENIKNRLNYYYYFHQRIKEYLVVQWLLM